MTHGIQIVCHLRLNRGISQEMLSQSVRTQIKPERIGQAKNMNA